MFTPSRILSRWLAPQKGVLFKLEDVGAILDLLPQAAMLVDWADFHIILANALATEMTAYMRTELVGQDLGSILAASDPDVSLKEALKTSTFYTSGNSFYVTTRSGGKVNVKASVMQDTSAKWMLISLEAEKQLERKQIEEERAHQLWKNLNQLSQALLSEELGASLEMILQAACQITGADCAAIYQANGETPALYKSASWGDSEFLPDQTQPQDLINTKETYLWVRRMHPLTILQSRARQAGLAYLASSPLGDNFARVGMIVLGSRNSPLALLPDALPVLASFASTAVDITSRANRLKELLEVSEYAGKTADQLKNEIEDNLILLKPDLTIMDFNRAAERSLGYSLKEAADQPYERIIISSERLDHHLSVALESNTPSLLEDIKLFRRNGQAFAAQLRIIPIHLLRQGPGIAILFQDFSEKEMILQRNEILEQRAVLGEVTASFAHEVRNPINNISTGLQLLEINLPANDPNQENIKRLQTDCNRLTALIKSGLSLVRPMEYKMESIQVGEMLENLLATWRYRLERNNVVAQLQVEPKLPQVEGDLRAMEQIFTNLINNAVDAMNTNQPDHARLLGIKVRQSYAGSEQSQVVVSVSDTGPGIPDEIRERIFEPFFTTKPGGTGIGLAIVKRIVTAHKGSIYVESVPGSTVFQVQFPIWRDKILRM